MLKKREVIIISDYGFVNGGAARVAVDSAINMARSEKFNVTFVCTKSDDKTRRYFSDNNVSLVCLPVQCHWKPLKVLNYLFNIKSFFLLKKLLISFSIDSTIYVHTYVNEFTSSLFLSIPNFRKRKVFLTAHDYFTICPNGAHYNFRTHKPCKIRGGGGRCYLTQCDKRNWFEGILRRVKFSIEKAVFFFRKPEILSISEVSKAKLCAFGYSTNVVLNQISLSIGDKIASFDSRSGLLYIGRLDDEKGYHQLIEACIKYQIPLKVIGDIDGKVLPKTDLITHIGWCDKDRISSYIKEARAVIMPSIWYESFGLVPLEAAVFGTPTILSRRCGVADYFPRDYDLFFEPEDFEELPILLSRINEKKYWLRCSKASMDTLVSYKTRADKTINEHVKNIWN
ncbi:glycosyl transferase group 1 [Vibrio nigripulchritudo ATCC 27043]|uniref:glycosyltransferase family 4 protein n=1 Tax=Vibrio nigripulchritudo TaxID=28173 RepID=UPI00021C189C|nr:glycosyltransferase family 4 protein [Vibrio nigripulchritudo]EGU56690.1 glycosyl transferase group 1 [Vibrio nigripulchritudo ATCC 27043]